MSFRPFHPIYVYYSRCCQNIVKLYDFQKCYQCRVRSPLLPCTGSDEILCLILILFQVVLKRKGVQFENRRRPFQEFTLVVGFLYLLGSPRSFEKLVFWSACLLLLILRQSSLYRRLHIPCSHLFSLELEIGAYLFWLAA